MKFGRRAFLAAAPIGLGSILQTAEEPLSIATFQFDVTPPLGAPLCLGGVKPAAEIVGPLSARGIILFAGQAPIVLCAVDWVAISNEGHDEWRQRLAGAASTTIDRVAVHCLHQHDAPGYDPSTERLLAAAGLPGRVYDPVHARDVLDRGVAAVRTAATRRQPVSHIALGKGKVERVASTRRVLGPDGKVKYVRYSATRNPDARAEPEGLIDPDVRLVSFWNRDRPLASLTYYATHPQSYYGQGGVSADFVGMARSLRETDLRGPAHIHFDGAGGNVTAGKYNDGSPENRPALAQRLANGMKLAWEQAAKAPLGPAGVEWRTVSVALPYRGPTDETALLKTIQDAAAQTPVRMRAARDLAWLRRVRAGHKIQLACLRLGSAYIVHMPGELFVEYQLAAQRMRPKDFVCMAAYGDDGPGYIGTEIAYSQGGYETGVVSRVAPDVEAVLMAGMRRLLAG